jgi:alkylation response protein AidB-like acyl-CoA dehydrogenase
VATAFTEEYRDLQEKASGIARENISRRDLCSTSEFPWDIWRAMAKSGLLGLTIPQEYGGGSGGYLALAVAGEALVRHGGNLGLALSVAMHNIIAGFLILGLGNGDQRRQYLPAMASGKITGSLAISEPETGAHPKYLKTRATRESDWFKLNGEKTYLTNGPIADFYVVIAVTGMDRDRKQLSAFLVPKSTNGLIQTGPIPLDFLRPCLHGGIKLENAMVPVSNALGPDGQAYQSIIKPFREVEDAALMGPMVGGLARQLELTTKLIRQEKASSEDDLKNAVGGLQVLVNQARILAYEAGAMLDNPPHEEFLSLLLAGREILRGFQAELTALITNASIKPTAELESLTRDLTVTGNIAMNVMLKKQTKMGEEILDARVDP